MAELAFGLLCGCFPIIPRLYQHLTSISPYNKNSTATAVYTYGSSNVRLKELIDRNGNSDQRDWTQLEGQRSLPQIPPKAKVGGRCGSDDSALESAVEGEVEMGSSKE